MDKKFKKCSGYDVFNGNELIIKGALEAGVSLVTGYPGSPVADVFDVANSIKDLLLEHGILAQLANNEALSVARLNGSQMIDVRAMAVMKSVGLHVASDGLALGNLSKFGKKGGALVVVAHRRLLQGASSAGALPSRFVIPGRHPQPTVKMIVFARFDPGRAPSR